MLEPFFPIIYLWIHVGASTVAVFTELAFSQTFDKADKKKINNIIIKPAIRMGVEVIPHS